MYHLLAPLNQTKIVDFITLEGSRKKRGRIKQKALHKKENIIHLQFLMPDGVIGNTLRSDLGDSWFESLSGNTKTLSLT